ncbi:efflux RND transporter permease subunit [Candidatus Uabimicrobium amorphum]|uniref:Multidrug transporter AcrB n=1 Tax=Uabimicrobium amorphum TaxID=2596890 RepID=A0A5S9IJM3_UABAM|nr:efflux RND transporter permease subunit [Candidatus Uabimicrobium amorphum]BBM83063.1 multidrug transporter AcrB [Candidatus Uabimicrobium amorphum]
MNLSTLGYKYSRVSVAITLILMLIGFTSYFTLPAQEDPKILVREAVVTTEYPGMSAERVELLITKKLEEAIKKLSQVKKIESVSTIGKSIIHVTIKDRYFNLSQIWDDLHHEIEQATVYLPQGTTKPFINDDFDDVAILTVALLSDSKTQMGEKFRIAQHVRDMMLTVPGTKKVDLFGVQQERIFIEFTNSKLSQLGIAPNALIRELQEQNIIQLGGVIDTLGRSFSIRPTGNFQNIASIEQTPISVPPQGASIALRDVATVKRGTVDPATQKAYFNGQQAIVFAIYQGDRSNLLKFSPKMEKMLANLNRDIPAGYQLEIITRQADQVEKAVYGVTESVLQTLVTVIVVVVMFLGLRMGLIVGSIIPAAILITLASLKFSGMALERMSLATIIISLGLLVDNAIVVAEDFKKRLEEGESKDDILYNIGRTLAIPLLTSSATTVLVFMPLMLGESASNEYTRSISLVILFSLTISWFLSLVITPFLCYHFIRTTPKNRGLESWMNSVFEKLGDVYGKILRGVMRFRVTFLVSMLLTLVASVFLMSKVPVRFFPDSNRPQILIYLDLPAGSSIRETERALQLLHQKLQEKNRFPHIQSFASYAGFGGPRFVLSLNPIDPEDSKGFVMINVDKLKNLNVTIDVLRKMFFDEFPNLSARVTKMFLGPSDSSKIEVQIKGPDKDYIYKKASEIEDILRDIPGSIDIQHNWENRIVQFKIEINQSKARRVGITSQNVANTLRTYLSGRNISEFYAGDEIFPVVLRAQSTERFRPSQIKHVYVYSEMYKKSFPLMQIAQIKLENRYARIAREDLFRTVTIEAKNTLMTAEDMVPMLRTKLQRLVRDLPPAYTIEFDGVVQDSLESQQALNANVPLCVGLIVILLIAQFNSYRRATIIFLTIPFIVIGSAVGLIVMKANIGFMVILGLYALAGIIVNNAIVLIDRIDIDAAQQGLSNEVIFQACTRRFRPIVISTTTTVFGVLPLILNKTPLFYSMSVVIAFGLTVGTVITLGLVPVLFSLFFRVRT